MKKKVLTVPCGGALAYAVVFPCCDVTHASTVECYLPQIRCVNVNKSNQCLNVFNQYFLKNLQNPAYVKINDTENRNVEYNYELRPPQTEVKTKENADFG